MVRGWDWLQNKLATQQTSYTTITAKRLVGTVSMKDSKGLHIDLATQQNSKATTTAEKWLVGTVSLKHGEGVGLRPATQRQQRRGLSAL